MPVTWPIFWSGPGAIRSDRAKNMGYDETPTERNIMTDNNTPDPKVVEGEVLDSKDEPRTVRLPSKRTMKRFALGAIGAGAALFAANRLGKKSGYDEAVDDVVELSTPDIEVEVSPEV